MTVVISGDTGISPVTASGTSASVDGMTVGRGGGEVSTNTAVGASALAATATGGANTVLGAYGLYVNTSGASNTSIGYNVLQANTSGSFNVAVGRDSLQANTTASNNTAVGYQAGYANTTGARNTFIGYLAGYTSAVVSANAYNTFVGAGAGQYTTTGAQNTFIGDTAGQYTTGGLNTFIGQSSGFAITTGTKNSILGMFPGNQGGLDIRTASNNIVLSDGDGTPQIYYTNADNTWKIPQLYNNTSGSSANVVVLASGTIARSTSSLKYKRDVQSATHGLTELLQLRPVTYKGKDQKDGDIVFGGLIAEEVHEAGLTEFVQYADDGSPDALAYGNMVSLCVKSIQELKTIVDAQAAEIAELKAKVGI